jgi:predicted dehydrogenase
MLRFGLVGTGHWARSTHAPALASAPGVCLEAVWGRDHGAAAELAAQHGAKAHEHIGSLIDAVDAVAFAVPPDVQAAIAIRAARAGKHLLLEKPVSFTVAEADELVSAVEWAGVASVVFFTLRFDPRIRAWLADVAARAERAGGGWAGGAAEWLGAALRPSSPFNTPWRRDKGGLWDVGPHALSMLWACLGPVTSVIAEAGTGDLTHLVLHHKGGASSTATLTIAAPPGSGGHSLHVWGAAGRCSLPAEPFEPLAALRTAIAELEAGARSGRVAHPCDVRFGRDVTAVLAAAQAQLDASSGSTA